MHMKCMKRFLLRLKRDAVFLLALLLISLTVCPFIILSFSNGLFSIDLWLGVLSIVISVLFSPVGSACVIALGFLYISAKTGFGPLEKMLQIWTDWTTEFNSIIWDMEDAVEQEKGKAIVVYCIKKRKKNEEIDMKELRRHFYDGKMKYFGYYNYIRFLLKSGEDLTAHLRASKSEKNPKGDPLLLDEMRLGRMLLRHETRRMDNRMKNGTWD